MPSPWSTQAHCTNSPQGEGRGKAPPCCRVPEAPPEDAMAERKPFLLRLDPATHEAMQVWADSELRSLNAQIEYLLRRALREAGRLPSAEKGAIGPGGRTGAGGTDK